MKLKLTDNLFLKLLSLLIAIVLWLAVVNISDAEGTESFPLGVALINTDVITENGKVFRVESNTDTVRITVRARRSVLNDLKQSDFTLTADMKNDLKYNSLIGIRVQCKNKNINVDEDVTLDRYNVQVSIEDSATEQFPVIVRHNGEPANGLVVGSLIPEQTVIKITGPVSMIEKIKLVEALVDVTGLPGNAVKTCTLNLYDGADNPIDTKYLNFVGKSDGIDVTVSLLNTKTVPLKFNYSGTPAENYEITGITCKPETIDIAGTSDVLKGISRLEISESAVNVDGIDDELQLVVDVTQYLPSGIILKDEETASVLVMVEVEYVEPVEEEEDEEKEETEETDKDSTTTKPSTKPSTDSEDNKVDTDTGKDDNSNPETQKPETDNIAKDETTKGDTSADTGKQENQGTINNETESGEGVKTESNS